MTCVNKVKHREPRTFDDKELFEQHTIACYGFTAKMVVCVTESANEEAQGPGRDDAKRQSSSN